MSPSGFVIHPRGPEYWREDVFRRIPGFRESLGKRFANQRPSDSEVLDELRLLGTVYLPYDGTTPKGITVEGIFGVLPLPGAQLIELYQSSMKDFNQLIVDTVNELGDRGANVVTLGALTGSALTCNGAWLLRNSQLRYPISSGVSMTGAAAEVKIKQLISEYSVGGARVAVVGAASSIGAAVSKRLANESDTSSLLMVDMENRRSKKAFEIAESSANCSVEFSDSMEEIVQADIVAIFSNSSAFKICPQHLQPGAIVIDCTTPRNTTPELLSSGAFILDGDLLAAPGIHRFDYGTPERTIYACHAEAIVLNHFRVKVPIGIGNPWVGMADPELFPALWDMATELGFTIPPLHSFGQPLSLGELEWMKEVRSERTFA